MSGLRFFTIITTVVLGFIALFTSTSIYAYDGDPWKEPLILSSEQIPTNSISPDCAFGAIEAIDVTTLRYGMKSTYEGCISNAKDFSIAQYSDHENTKRWAYKHDSQSEYRVIENIDYQMKLTISRDANTIVFLQNPGGYAKSILSTISNNSDGFSISETDLSGKIIKYRLATERAKKWFPRTQDAVEGYAASHNFAVSLNGRYILAWLDYVGHAKVDVISGSVTALGRYPGTWFGEAVSNPWPAAITNDGRHAFITIGPTVINTENCGYDLTRLVLESGNAFANGMPECPSYSLFGVVEKVVGFNGYSNYFHWIGNEEGLAFLYRTYPYQADARERIVTLRKKDSDQSKLDYLALGDSFASGEGDIGRQSNGLSYYSPSTAHMGGCHLSMRSYPYLLRFHKEVSETRMKSVACSGSRVDPDYTADPTLYLGQGNRMAGYNQTDLISARQQAKNTYEPGFIPQLEFVKENKPRVITLMGGGNDVGFGPILAACAGTDNMGTCDYAKKNSEARAMLGEAIDAQYDATTKLIQNIKSVSPSTTIYVIGYPSFLAGKWSPCVNKAFLNADERELIAQGITYMNDVLKTVAKNQGAHFIDISLALEGGRICEGSEFVTTISDYIRGDATSYAELFHPNAEGHALMADDILTSGFVIVPDDNPQSDETARPTIPEYFVSTKDSKAQSTSMTSPKIIGGTPTRVHVVSIWKPGTKVKFTLHSKPTRLGELESTSFGDVSGNLMVPLSVEAGLHLLIAKGHDRTGKALRVYQFVEVVQEGVPSLDEQPCRYFKGWRDERTGETLCIQ